MKKSEYVEKISKKLKITKKEVAEVTDSFIEEMVNSLICNDKISITNFGTFKKNIIKEYNYFSPIDGRKEIAKNVIRITFTCSKELINKLQKKENSNGDY